MRKVVSASRPDDRERGGYRPPNWLILPLRGLRLSDKGPPAGGFFDRPWYLVSEEQFDLLAHASRDDSSLSGNVEMLVKRLRPDSILVVEHLEELDGWNVLQAFDDAETVIAALNIKSLLDPIQPTRVMGGEPTPIFRARFIEACDIPLVFNPHCLWISGHSSALAWAAMSQPGDEPRSSSWVHERVSELPPVARRALRRESQPNPIQTELELAMRNLTGAFQATSHGQFIASAVSSLETLLGDNWTDRETRLGQLLPTAYHKRLEDILNARHEFVHAARQPALMDAYFGKCALAMALQVWTTIAWMPETYLTREDLWYRIRSFTDGDALAASYPGPDRELEWVHRYLVASHPSEYQFRFVTNGSVYCPAIGCGTKLGKANVVATTGQIHRFKCEKCGREFPAADRS